MTTGEIQGEKPKILATCSISLAVLHKVEGRAKSCAHQILIQEMTVNECTQDR